MATKYKLRYSCSQIIRIIEVSWNHKLPFFVWDTLAIVVNRNLKK
jgi:hypothetical protein